MNAGRPIGSYIRQNIVEILHFMGKGCGYDVHKVYLELFPKATQRVIYYHLKKGVATGEFEVADIKTEKGDYSWGQTAEKVYYKLGASASPKIILKVKKYFDKKKKT
ncbi:MAG: hypothetical protein ABH828_03115 [archaeon]